MVFDPTAIADSKKLSLTLDSTAISADQTDFPLTIHLDGTDPLHAPIFADLVRPSITAKSVILDIADNYGGNLIGIRSVEFFLKGILVSVTTAFAAYATSAYSSDYSAAKAFDTRLSKTGAWAYTSWVSAISYKTNLRLSIVLTSPIEFDKIVINNGHSDGVVIDSGARNVKINTSSDAITSTVYNSAITNATLIFDGVFSQHPATDTVADQTLALNLPNVAAPKELAITQSGVQLPVEIENWDSTNEKATLHTKVPLYSAAEDSELVLSWDAEQVDNTGYVGVTGSIPAQSVWDSNFVFVSHQAQDPSGTAPQILDSTSYAKHGTSYGTMTSGDLIDGVTGKMLEYDGVNDYTNHGYNAAHNITTTLTLEVAFKPTTLLSSALVNDVGLISRQDDATDNADTFALIVNSAGLLHSDSQGGSIQGTTASWVAGTNFIVAATYNSTGLVGDLFKDGVKETLTTNSYNSMAGSATNNLVIGKNADTLEFFPGAIGEVRISKVVRSDDWIKLTHLSLTDALVTFAVALGGPILSVLRQQYDLAAVILLSVLRQRYDVYQLFISNLLQTYGEDFISVLRQSYGDKDLLLSVLRQPYRDFHLMMNVLVQKYGDTNAFISVLRQAYDMRTALLSTLRQPYSLSQIVGVGVLRQTYDISQVDILISTLNQRYSMLPEINTVSAMPSAITLGGVNSGITKLSLLYDIESYCGVFNFTLASEVDWLSINDTDPISFVLNGLTHVGVVTSKSSQERHGDATFSVEARSPSVLLDYPYARKIPETFISAGSASTIMNDIAALEGMSVVWHLQSDPPQTSTTFEAAGEYPLQAIRKLVNELGGRINSYPDGTIHIIKRQPTNSDAYETAPVVSVLTTLMDFESMDTSSDQRSGWNLFEVSSDSVSKEYRLVMEDVSEGHKIVKAYKTPWTSASVELVTSELTNASITMAIPVNPTTEKVEELDVELVDGQGKVQQPCYGDVIFDYGTRVNLGAITIEEDGTVKSAIVGQTLVNLTYTTKYWKWDVYDTDSESAQFILFTVI